jgi:hypothetical protein
MSCRKKFLPRISGLPDSHCLIPAVVLVLLFFHANAHGGSPLGPPPGGGPLEIQVKLQILKIYDINTVNETYRIDGYLNCFWYDERIKYIPDSQSSHQKIYLNQSAVEKMGKEVWFPYFEFINIHGTKEVGNLQLTVNSDGHVEYSERFFATFGSDMEYSRFPFDTQRFEIILEAFSYGDDVVVFKDPILFPALGKSGHILDKWEPVSITPRVETSRYDIDPGDTYSRAVFSVSAKRLPGYYIWQVLFPLILIISASFVIFWIKDFNTQIGVGFTLMLTVVAFNFFSASILPKLPYNTFMESVIIVGYIFIFLEIIAVLLNFKKNGSIQERQNNLFRCLRWLFPVMYAVTMVVLCTRLHIGGF